MLCTFAPDMTYEAGVTIDAEAASGIAFAPFRFAATLTGTLSEDGAAPIAVKESAILSIFPGSLTTTLVLVDLVGNDHDLASLSGSPWLVAFGFEVGEGTGVKFRQSQGVELPLDVQENGVASIGLRLEGKVAGNGRYKVKKGSGTLLRASGRFVFSGKLKSGALLD
jgi:hypothetical protein